MSSSPSEKVEKKKTGVPVWETVDQDEIGEARVEQMRKMFDTKTTMPEKEASYYDSVSINDNIHMTLFIILSFFNSSSLSAVKCR